MTHIRNDRTSRQRRRAGTTLVLAATSGGLLAAAMAAAATARADDPFTDIISDVQSSISAGEADFSAAATDFSTASDTDEGLINLLAGFDNTFVSPADYTLVGLTAAATGVDTSGLAGAFLIPGFTDQPLTQAGQDAIASADMTQGQTDLADVASLLSGGDFADAALFGASASYLTDILAPEADLLGALFGAGF